MGYLGLQDVFPRLLVCLLTAHVIGDFLFQGDRWAAEKHRPLVLFGHVLVVSGLSYLLCGLWRFWQIPLVLLTTHALLDWLKTRAPEKKLSGFLWDQGGHLAVILLLALLIPLLPRETPFWEEVLGKPYYWGLALLLSVVLMLNVGARLVGLAVAPWQEEVLDDLLAGAAQDPPGAIPGLTDAGKVIGQLERLLILVFILLGEMTAVGFLISVKAIFRFGDLTDPTKRKQAEYYIIGTLWSFLFALLVGLLTRYLLLAV